MSTRASIQIIDGDAALYFYQHSDGAGFDSGVLRAYLEIFEHLQEKS